MAGKPGFVGVEADALIARELRRAKNFRMASDPLAGFSLLGKNDDRCRHTCEERDSLRRPIGG